MNIECDSFDLNHFIDLFLPFYLILILFSIYSFQIIKQNKNKENEKNYKLISSNSTTILSSNSNENSNSSSILTDSTNSTTTILLNDKWKDLLNGYWNICWADDLDKWLKYLKKPYVRTMAQTMFFQIKYIIKLTNNNSSLLIERERGGKLENWILNIKIGKSENDCEELIQNDHEDHMTSFRAWINEQTQELYLQSIPTDTTKNGLKLLTIRKIIDDNTMLMVNNIFS